MGSAPFSNGTEFDLWTHNVCGHGTGCLHDGMFGNPDRGGVWCPLIDAAYQGEWPTQWIKGDSGMPVACTSFDEL